VNLSTSFLTRVGSNAGRKRVSYKVETRIHDDIRELVDDN
jgi:hypothetical protein